MVRVTLEMTLDEGMEAAWQLDYIFKGNKAIRIVEADVPRGDRRLSVRGRLQCLNMHFEPTFVEWGHDL